MCSSTVFSRRKATQQSLNMIYSAVIAATILLYLVTYSESRSLREIIKGKGKYIPDDCDPLHCNSGHGCKNGTEVCKERIIYGDIIVCRCLSYKLADIPIIVDLTSNQFKK